MIERTRRKLDEARFFYQHLVDERATWSNSAFKVLDQRKRDPAAFRYYFSAFIQAARSVTWTLGNEEPEKWKVWKPKWESTLSAEDKKLLAFTNELRLDEVKRGGASPNFEFEEVALHELLAQRPSHVQLFVPLDVAAPTEVAAPTARRPAYYFEHNEGKEEVTALCTRYLSFLDKMLNDFCANNQPASPE